MFRETYPYYLANEPHAPNADLEVLDKYTGETATRVAMADAEAIDRAIGAAHAAATPMRELRAYERQTVLDHCVRRFKDRAEELTMALCIEATESSMVSVAAAVWSAMRRISSATTRKP